MSEVTAIIVCDRAGTVIGWSTGAQALLGYGERDAVGRKLEALCGRGATGSGVVTLTTQRGAEVRVDSVETAIHDAAGESFATASVLTPLATRGAPRDITQAISRDDAHDDPQVAHVPSIASVHRLIANAPQGCALLDAEGRVVFANAALERMLGYPLDGLAGTPVETLVPADVRALHADEVHAYVAAPRFRRLDEPVLARRRDGTGMPVLLGLGPVRTEREQFVLAYVVDLSAQLRLDHLLRDIEARFRQFTQALPQMAWTCEPNGKADFVSAHWEHYIGLAGEDLLARPLLEHVHPDDRDRTASAWRGALESGVGLRVEARLGRHDGAYRWFDIRASPMRDGFGRILKWVGSCADVHEAVETRAALEREQQLLARIIETSPGAFCSFRLSSDGAHMPFASPRIEEILGFAPSLLARSAKQVREHVHPDDLPRVRATLLEAAARGAVWHCEFRYRHPEGSERWLEVQWVPTLEEGATLWFGFLRDVSERKRADESLRVTQGQLVAALEAGGMGIWSWAPADDHLWMDDALLGLLGRRRDELAGSRADLLSFVHPDDAARIDATLERLASAPSETVYECRVVDARGGLRFLAVRARSEREPSGPGMKITALNIDITAQHRAAEARLRSQKLEALGTLAGGIAHDFNNILQAIGGNTALALRMVERSHRARPFLAEVAAASARASDLVRRILTFSRPGEQRLEVLALQPVIAEALRLVRATVPALIEIEEALGDEPLHVLADGTQIHQIVVNLATNAAHAIGSREGRIAVRVARVVIDGTEAEAAGVVPGPCVRLEVADDGSGMAPDVLARIFDPFFTTKPVGQGTGLGLSVVHGLAKSLGGGIHVDSELGRGTRFRLYFPLADAPRPSSQETSAPRAAAGQRILFVDDEEVLVTLGTHILDALGYRADGYHRAREALEAFCAAPERFDAVVTDLSMPGISGFELSKRVRALRPELPVIMMSGFVGPDEIEAAATIGVRELLLKPVSIEQLGEALAKVLALA